jgi:hypothetical protein
MQLRPLLLLTQPVTLPAIHVYNETNVAIASFLWVATCKNKAGAAPYADADLSMIYLAITFAALPHHCLRPRSQRDRAYRPQKINQIITHDANELSICSNFANPTDSPVAHLPLPPCTCTALSSCRLAAASQPSAPNSTNRAKPLQGP